MAREKGAKGATGIGVCGEGGRRESKGTRCTGIGQRKKQEASNRNNMGTVGKQKERRRRKGTGSGQGAARCEVRGRRQGKVDSG